MNHPTPRISILIPNLNQRPFLEERLRSILNQTLDDWELVIVDNYSDDGSWEFFQELPERDGRIRLSQAPRRGMYDNWNNCLRLARGEYVYIATSDDTMEPDFLERMVRAMDENPECELAHCKLRIIDENGEPRIDLNWDGFYCVRFFREWIDREHIRRAPHDGIVHCGVRTVYTSITQLVMRRSLFDRVGLFATDFGSAADFEWGMRASLLAHTVHVPYRLATWRVHGKQGTDMRSLDSPGQKRLLIRMIRRAFRAARRIDPAGLRRLRLGDLTYLYRKEWLYATMKEARCLWAPGPVPLQRKIGIGLFWLWRDPLVFIQFYRRRHNVKSFLPTNAPLAYPRQLLAKYGFGGSLVSRNPRPAAGDSPLPAALSPEPTPDAADFTKWPPEDLLTAEAMKQTHPWLFNDPPAVQLDVNRFPVLIYQMGKVGSTSVDFTLKESGFPHPIYHVHQLHPSGIAWTIRDARESLVKTLGNPSLDSPTRVMNALYLRLVLREYQQNLSLYQEIRGNLDRIPWHIITLVRDPVMREISDFFFSLHRYPELLTLSGEPMQRQCLRDLTEKLHKEFRARSPWTLNWFDSELGKVFDVDVYRFPFDLQKGYSILEAGNTRILVLKLERLSECFSEAMERFLNIRDLKLINQNTAQQKNYYETYRHVLPAVTLDADLCRAIYDSKYCRHFFSEEERSEWFRRWTTPSGKVTVPLADQEPPAPPQADGPILPGAGRAEDAAEEGLRHSVKGSRHGDLKRLEERLAQLDATLALERQNAKAKMQEVAVLAARLEEKSGAIALLESKVNLLLNSRSFRIGKGILLPLQLARRLVFQLRGAWPGSRPPQAAGISHPAPPTAERKISANGQLHQDFGRHRSGLKYGLQYLLRLHHPRGVLLDAFVEKTFAWQPQKKFMYDRPWIGFIHTPPRPPVWFHPQVNNESIFRSETWQRSLPFCQGLFAFSRYHQRQLQERLPVSVEVLRLPSEVPRLTWSWEAFASNPCRQIVQVGWWLRRLNAIYQLPKTHFKKVFLHVGHPSLRDLMAKERELMAREGSLPQADLDSVETIPFLSNNEYDRLLSRNIVFMELYDSSACNAIVECMVRHTPLLINPLEAVVEYLGEKYPFYFNSLAEAAEKAMSQELIYQTHEYLCRHSRQLELHGEHFFRTFLESGIYRSLALPEES